MHDIGKPIQSRIHVFHFVGVNQAKMSLREGNSRTPGNTAKKVETLVEDAQKAANDQVAKITKSFEDAAAFGQDNVDALVKTSSLAVKAAEEMNAELASYSKKAFEEGVAVYPLSEVIAHDPQLAGSGG